MPATLTPAAAPLIVSDPQPVSVCAGSFAQLSVSASGDPLPSYQWRRNATPIAASNLSDPKLQSLLENMGHDALSVDQLVARSGLPVASVQAALLHLEMQGHIECLAGGQVRRLIA
jgi:DNA processing protein